MLVIRMPLSKLIKVSLVVGTQARLDAVSSARYYLSCMFCFKEMINQIARLVYVYPIVNLLGHVSLTGCRTSLFELQLTWSGKSSDYTSWSHMLTMHSLPPYHELKVKEHNPEFELLSFNFGCFLSSMCIFNGWYSQTHFLCSDGETLINVFTYICCTCLTIQGYSCFCKYSLMCFAYRQL